MGNARPGRIGAAAVGAVLIAATAAAADVSALQSYETRYYTLHTDLDQEGVQEATVRITLMAEEYHTRTKGLAGTVNKRLPLYLFGSLSGYTAAGGRPGSAGVYTGDRLMALVNPAKPEVTWECVQHEGFHQFVDAAIGRQLPIWANEGMAEYFAAAQFTGDQFIVGLIPPERLRRVQDAIKRRAFRPLREMLSYSHEEWNANLRGENYDQAWAMVQFLAHGDGGKYEQAFMSFLREMARKTPWEQAWTRAFGTDVSAFQKRFDEYWTGLPENPTRELYEQAVVLTLTSYYARATIQGQRFETAEEFFAAAAAGELKMNPQEWLPPRLVKDAAEAAAKMGEWKLEGKGNRMFLTCTLADGSGWQGKFTFGGGRVKTVRAEPVKKRK